MDPIYDFDLEECPACRGAGCVEEEHGWCVYVSCLDCGSQTAHISYNTPEERLAAAKQAVHLWNVGKVVHTGASD